MKQLPDEAGSKIEARKSDALDQGHTVISKTNERIKV